MTFEYRFVDRQKRYALGVDHETGSHFFSFIPPTFKCNYEEFYVITPAQSLQFQTDADAAVQFAAAMQLARKCEFGDPEALLIISIQAGHTKPRHMAPAQWTDLGEVTRLRRHLTD